MLPQKAELRDQDVLWVQTQVHLKTKGWGLLPDDDFSWEGTAYQEEVTTQQARHGSRGQVHLWAVVETADRDEPLLALSSARPEDEGGTQGQTHLHRTGFHLRDMGQGQQRPLYCTVAGRKPRQSGNACPGHRVGGRGWPWEEQGEAACAEVCDRLEEEPCG